MGRQENYVEDYLVRKGEEHGFMVLKFKTPGVNGVPDRILIGHKKTIFVETKAPGKKTRALQDAIIKKMRLHDAEIYICDTREKVDLLLADYE